MYPSSMRGNPGKGNAGTVTSVTSTDTSIGVLTSTTTPKLRVVLSKKHVQQTTTPTATQALVYTAGTGLWVPKTLATGGAAASFISGSWYGSQLVTTASGVLSRGGLRFTRWTLQGSFTVKALGCKVKTAVASTTIRLGLYGDSGHGQPKAKILDLGVVSSATTGVKTKAATHVLTAGVYWFCVVRQGSATTGSLRLCHITTTWFASQNWGNTTIAVTRAFVAWISTATTFTSTLPATAPALSEVTGPATGAPSIQAKSA